MVKAPRATAQPRTWDIFCTVIDNFGDIGVCWRLARQLQREYGQTVRLWVDDLSAFQRLLPAIDMDAATQTLDGLQIIQWRNPAPMLAPGDVVVEAFACDPPATFLAAMAQRQPVPVWINLEYLSAESWVEGCHRLSSKHRDTSLQRHFFFPGFSAATGGLLRESDLLACRRTFQADAAAQTAFWQRVGVPSSATAQQCVSLFCYQHEGLADWLQALTSGSPLTLLVADGKPRQQVATWLGESWPIGSVAHRGSLTLCALPFLSQDDYDRLLWACDINFVRGEDSFVRAQWAGKPLIWHIYPQDEAAHLQKLDAFLARYEATLSSTVAVAHRRLQHTWNEQAGQQLTDAWHQLLPMLPELQAHASQWCDQLTEQADLAAQLLQFIEQSTA